MQTADFTYLLPDEAIAQRPIEPRHAARLLDTRDMSDRTFVELPDLFEPEDLLVVNETKVRAARLRGAKASGGAVEVLLLRRMDETRWEALVKPARKIRRGTLLQLGELTAEVIKGPTAGVATLDLSGAADVEAAIARHGETPLPPYIREPLDDGGRYQTIFARSLGSAAAPTAGLHFTNEVVAGLQEAGIRLVPVELEVGLDTFRPISTERIDAHEMHAERYGIPAVTAQAIAETRGAGGRVVAVGTTVVRTLESAATDDGELRAGSGSTELFITPGYRFRIVDALVTNFHVPGSTLVVLLAAFMGPRWRLAYAHALARGYRFLSFGDAMYAERTP